MSMRWYAVHTLSGSEEKAMKALEQRVEMYELDEKTGEPKKSPDGSFAAKTSHTLNPVPCIFYDNQTRDSLIVRPDPDLGLSNLAATIVNLLGHQAPEAWDRGILEFDGGAEVGTVR